MSVVIGTTIAGTIAKATGRGHQGHLQWATNDAGWWLFYIASGDTTHLLTYRSPDGISWTAKTANLWGFSLSHDSDGMDHSIVYKNKASVDVFHNDSIFISGGNYVHTRATTAAATITWGTPDQAGSSGPKAGGIDSCWASNDFLYAGGCDAGNLNDKKSTNADAGSSWTSGMGAWTNLDTSSTVSFNVNQVLPTSTNRALSIFDDGANATTTTKWQSRTWDGTTIGGALNISGTITAQDKNDMCACHLSDTDIHLVYRTGSNTFTHKRWNGTDWTTVSGAAITNQTHKAGSGIGLVSDGTAVWLIIIDSDAANTVRYCKWTSNSWSAWSIQEASTQVRNYISVSPNLDASGNIGMIWTQTNGSNFDIVFSSLATITTSDPFPAGYKHGDVEASLYYPYIDPLPPYWEQLKDWALMPSTFLPLPPTMEQHSQRIEPLFVLDSWWEQFRLQPIPRTFLPQPPTLRQASQRWDDLPNYWQEYVAYTEQPYAQWYSPPKPPTYQLSQRWDDLPNLWQEYSAYLEQPYVQWFTPPAPPTRQPSQRWDDLPNYWQEWEAFTEVPYSQWYIPARPSMHQASQRWDALPDYWQEYEAYTEQPYAAWYSPPRPPTHQLSQRWDALPDYWQEWEAYTKQPYAQWYIPDKPVTHQADQHVESLPVLDSWWEQFRHWPTPVQFVIVSPYPQPSQRWDDLPNLWQEYEAYTEQPYAQWYSPPKPPTHQLDQRWDSAIDYTFTWFEQRYDWPIPVAGPTFTCAGSIVCDRFTDTDGTNLTAHTPDVVVAPASGGWVILTGTITVQSNQAKNTGAGDAYYTFNTGASDGSITGDIVVTGAGNGYGLEIRRPDINHGWTIGIDQAGNRFLINEQTGPGTFVTRASVSVTINTGTTYTLAATFVGSTITATINGGNQISYGSATSNQNITTHGMSIKQNWTMDNWRVNPAAFIPMQDSQRWDAVPDITYSWFEQFREQPIPTTFLPPPPLINPQRSQRVDPLPVLDSWWEQFREQPVPVSFIVSVVPTRQLSQRIEPLFDPWQEWEAFAEPPYAQWYSPPKPPTHQSSQRWDALPDYTALWWEDYTQSPYAQWYVPFAPLPHQASQRWDAAIDFALLWWENQRQPNFAQWFVPTKPPTHQPSQRWDPLPDYNVLWWEQYYYRPMLILSAPVVLTISWAGTTNLGLSWQGTTNITLGWTGITNKALVWTGVG